MSGTTAVDLDAYFARIGYSGPRAATLGVLRAIHALHPAAIPFEAIDVLLDRGIDLSPAAVDAKLIHARRGGYCYEQNSLLKRVLTALGFEVEGLIARVRWQAPPDAPLRAPSHMVLRITINGDAWLADVGFGGAVLTAPIRFDVGDPQPTRHEDFRLTPMERGILLQTNIGKGWEPVYEVIPHAILDIDFQHANWFSSTHPSSHFRHDLMAARTTDEAKYVLKLNRLTIRHRDGRVDRRMLDAHGIAAALREIFLLPVAPDWWPILERAAAHTE